MSADPMIREWQHLADDLAERAERAEAERDQLREALRELIIAADRAAALLASPATPGEGVR